MKTAMLGLHAETSIHAGAGSTLDVIDLPIMREAHTGWPCVFGSAVKGALRRAAEVHGVADTDMAFGPRNVSNDAYAGALMVGDARLVLLPLRSLTTHFKWVTCPAVLQRLKRDAERMGITTLGLDIHEPKAEEVWVSDCENNTSLFLEEYKFTAQPSAMEQLVQTLATLSAVEGFAGHLKKQLVVMRNDDFTYLAKHATPVTPHIALEASTKSVKSGALWYEETLPPETLMYVCLAADNGRNDDGRNKEVETKTAEQMLKVAEETIQNSKTYLQLGGNETLGMGWCKVKIVKQEKE